VNNPYRQAEKDLNWYFNHSEAAIGFKSSHASFVAAVYGVTSTLVNPDTYTDGMLRQIRKLRQIRTILYSLPIQSRRTLEACYCQEYQFYYPPEIVRIYGNKSGASFFNKQILTLTELTKLCQKKIKSKLTASEQVLMFNAGEEIRLLWNEVHQQYMDARQVHLNSKSIK
jgi:hypothetical protein